MKLLIFLALFFLGINFKGTAQVTLETDTLKNLPYVCQADSFTVTVSGMHWNSGYILDSVHHSFRNDSLVIDIYYTFFIGFGVLSPFQLPLRFGTPQPANYTIYSQRFTNGILVSQGNSGIAVCTTVSGLRQKAALPEIKVFPNPTQNILNIEISQETPNLSAQLSDLTGKIILSKDLKASEAKQIDIENLKSGIYLLHLETGQGKTVKKIVKN